MKVAAQCCALCSRTNPIFRNQGYGQSTLCSCSGAFQLCPVSVLLSYHMVNQAGFVVVVVVNIKCYTLQISTISWQSSKDRAAHTEKRTRVVEGPGWK